MIDLEKEKADFQAHHTNRINIWINIVCGFLFMTFLLLLLGPLKYVALVIYILFLWVSFGYRFFILGIGLVLAAMVAIFSRWNLSQLQLVVLFFFFYFASAGAHWATGEPTILTMEKMGLEAIFVNTFYFIPFSLFCLDTRI
jgi:hypothetical protein